MSRIKEYLKALLFIVAIVSIGSLCILFSNYLNAYWTLFITIPLLLLVGFIITVNSTVSIKCNNCGKELGVTTGGFYSVWFPEKPDKCKWCGHKTV